MSAHKLCVGCQIKLEKYVLPKKINANINCLLLIEKAEHKFYGSKADSVYTC